MSDDIKEKENLKKRRSIATSILEEEEVIRKGKVEEIVPESETQKLENKAEKKIKVLPKIEFKEPENINYSINIDSEIKIKLPFQHSEFPIPIFEELPKIEGSIKMDDNISGFENIKPIVIEVTSSFTPILVLPSVSFEPITGNLEMAKIDGNIPEILESRDENEKQNVEAVISGGSYGNYSELEGELLFEEIFQGDNVGALLHPLDRARVIIVPNEEIADILTIFLKELYRTRKGGYPQVIIKETYDKKFEEALYDLKAEGRIMIIHSEIFNSIEKDNWKAEVFKEKIKEVNFQSLGYLIFIDSHFVKADNQILGHKMLLDILNKIIRWTWIKSINKNAVVAIFSSHEEENQNILKIENEYYEKLMKLLSEDVEICAKAKTQEEFEGRESDVHYALKIFVARYLKKNGFSFEIEEKTDEKRPDIIVGSSTGYEIETFYGVGPKIYRKLAEKIENTEISKIYYIIPPIQAILYQKEVMRFLKYASLKNKGKRVEVKTVDIFSEELIDISDFYKRIKDILSKPH